MRITPKLQKIKYAEGYRNYGISSQENQDYLASLSHDIDGREIELAIAHQKNARDIGKDRIPTEIIKIWQKWYKKVTTKLFKHHIESEFAKD